MDTVEHSHTLEQIPADRKLIETLYAHGKITREARDYALKTFRPHAQWGVWVSRLLLMIGAALVLFGIVYFFAFNWAKIGPFVKLFLIQAGLIACLIGAYVCSLQRIGGQILLLSASVLVGVFIAVSGQIYQTGADSYQLFMIWSLLALGWTLLSNFTVQWIVWLVITNMCLVLWWRQAVLPTEDMQYMLFTCMTVFNGAVLALREYCALKKAFQWLAARWVRAVLASAVLIIMAIPVIVWISEAGEATSSVMASGTIGLIGHGAIYYVYRHKLPDMWPLAAMVLSSCIILETAIFKILGELFSGLDTVTFALAGLTTLGLFAGAIIYLRKTANRMEAGPV